MAVLTRISNLPFIAPLLSHLRNPLYRNGYALVLSSGASSALGMIYWIVAARVYSIESIGLNAAVVSAIVFLTDVSQLNLKNALIRFLPGTNLSPVHMILVSYAVSLIMAIISSSIFILGVTVWVPELGFLASSPIFIVGFILATMIWCMFTLQDSALIGLRQATWVPLKTMVFALIKIGLLVALALASPDYGVMVSWIFSALVSIVPIHLLIFRKFIPGRVQPAPQQEERITVRQIAGYVAGDYFGSLIVLAAMSLLPVLIVARVGAEANAYFYLAWTIAYSLYLISANLGTSLIAELSSDSSNLKYYSYRIFVQAMRLLVPLVVFVVIGARPILRLLGEEYAVEGVGLLRLLALSALPNVVTSVYTSVVRVQRRMTALVLMLTLPYILVIAISYALLDVYGVVGVGAAWLLGQSLTAGFLLSTEFRFLWQPKLRSEMQGNH